MAYDLEEQEQLASFKAFWKQYGNLVVTLLTVVLLAIVVVSGMTRTGREEVKA